MAERKEVPPQIFVGILVVVLLIVGYFLWTRTSSSDPVIPPDQDIKHPFGQAKAGGPGRGMGGVPAPGTVDPQRGMGPSVGAAERMKNH